MRSRTLLAAAIALAAVTMTIVACEPTPPPAVVNPVPPVVRFVERTIEWFWGQEKAAPPPNGDGKWHPRKVDCAVIAHNEQVNSAGIMPVTPLDGYALLFPAQWYMSCFPFRGPTANYTAVRTLKGSGAANVPTMTPTIQCKMRPPFLITVGTFFECYIESNSYWYPQARTDPAYLQVIVS